jgi:hypothetical protein
MALLSWQNATNLQSRSHVCGYCGNALASNVGYFQDGNPAGFVYICHHCKSPSFFDQSGQQTPGVRPGADVKGIDEGTVEKLYGEARDCFSKNAFTGTILCCRKLLMHIAVAKGAESGKNFVDM